jgi:hypothetical protein
MEVCMSGLQQAAAGKTLETFKVQLATLAHKVQQALQAQLAPKVFRDQQAQLV